jgi:hypothetical protein
MERTMAGNGLAARMELCRECLVLRGPFFDWNNGCERAQRCGCEAREPLWNAFDYNCAAELCRCCAAHVIPCGSKWSVFFCAGCKPQVGAYNGAAGRKAIPVGRHSMMNGVALNTMSAGRAGARRAFTRGVSGVFDGIDQLERFHRAQVRRIVSSVDAPGPTVPAPQYIEHATRSLPSREAVFAALILETDVAASGPYGSP